MSAAPAVTAIASAAAGHPPLGGRAPGCPKGMVFGPCGGVAPDGSCEVPSVGACTFLHAPVRAWPTAAATGLPPPPLAVGGRPLVLAHAVATPLSPDGLRRVADALAGPVDAVLCGDSPSARVQLPPSFRARILLEQGTVPLVGVNCRDRNRVALEGELAALATLVPLGLAGVHCVTGDHTTRGHRPDAAPVFDLDATRLTDLARRCGLRVSVAVAPASPPGVAERTRRLVEKVHAGAGLALVDDAEPAVVAALAAAVAAAVGPLPLIVSVPVLTSAAAARGYPGTSLPAALLQRVAGARDPRKAGLRAAVELARELLAVPGVIGVHLGAGVLPGAELEAAADLALVAAEVRG